MTATTANQSPDRRQLANAEASLSAEREGSRSAGREDDVRVQHDCSRYHERVGSRSLGRSRSQGGGSLPDRAVEWYDTYPEPVHERPHLPDCRMATSARSDQSLRVG